MKEAEGGKKWREKATELSTALATNHSASEKIDRGANKTHNRDEMEFMKFNITCNMFVREGC